MDWKSYDDYIIMNMKKYMDRTVGTLCFEYEYHDYNHVIVFKSTPIMEYHICLLYNRNSERLKYELLETRETVNSIYEDIKYSTNDIPIKYCESTIDSIISYSVMKARNLSRYIKIKKINELLNNDKQ